MTPISATKPGYQHPEESVLYGADLAILLTEPNETILASFTPVVTILPAGPTLPGTPAIDGTIVKFRVEGVAAGTDYKVKVKQKTTIDGSTPFDTRVLICHLYGRDE